MPFLSYNSIVNHYNEKEIDFFIKNNSDYLKADFVAQHKYDGSNFQIIFEKKSTEMTGDDSKVFKPIQFGSRNCLLEENENFNNYKSVIKKEPFIKMLSNIEKYLNENPDLQSINLYGEIYGKVIKRINYYAPDESQADNKLIFYDVKFNEIKKTTKFFMDWAQQMEIPVAETFLKGTYEEVLAIDVKKYKTVAGDQIEGVVIKPFDHEDFEIQSFYLKKKVDGFEEVSVKKPTKEKVEAKPKQSNVKCTNEQREDLEKLENYLNLNRVQSAFSKKPWTKTETVALANEVLIDALKDFKIDNEKTTIDLDLAKKAFIQDIFKLIKDEKIL